MNGVNDSWNLSQADHVLQAQVLDVGLPHADELAQQAHTGLQQLRVRLHGQSQSHCLKDDGVLGVVLVDVLGHLIACIRQLDALFLLMLMGTSLPTQQKLVHERCSCWPPHCLHNRTWFMSIVLVDVLSHLTAYKTRIRARCSG